MSVSALARLIGIPQSNLSQMLSGNRDWSKAAEHYEPPGWR